MDPLHTDIANSAILAIIALANLATAIIAVMSNNRSKKNQIILEKNHEQVNRLETNTNDKMDKVIELTRATSLAAGNAAGRVELLNEQNRERKNQD